jgi:uncharacterized membrane protein HdeD (DUF308 family)
LLALTGMTIFSRHPHTTMSLVLLGTAIACFAIEAAIQNYYLAGILATDLLATGFLKLGVAPELSWPLTIALGAITIALLSKAKQARKNKHLDI